MEKHSQIQKNRKKEEKALEYQYHWLEFDDESLLDYLKKYWVNFRYFHQINNIISFKNHRILDVGSGGPTSVLNIVEGERYGVDPLINEFQQVYKLNREIHWYNAYVEDLPFRDHYFDIVICSNSLDHVEDNHKTISEINRVLKHEGKLLLTVDIFNEKVKRDDKHPYAFMDEDIPKLIWNYNILFFKKSQTNANLYEYMKCQNLQKNEITKPDSKDNLNIPGKKGEVTFSEVVIVAEKI